MERPGLANAELALMELLWERERSTARELREALYPDSTKAQHGTVQRLLQRLEKKGFVERDNSLSVHFFSAKMSRQSYACDQLESLADKLMGGSLAPLITHFIAKHKISREELSQLREVFNEEREEISE